MALVFGGVWLYIGGSRYWRVWRSLNAIGDIGGGGRQGRVVFFHDGRWLHPLFAFLDFLETAPADRSTLFLRDKIIGRGAAVLIAQAGIQKAHGGIVSERALPILKAHGVAVTWDTLVEHLQCMTERLITNEMPLDQAVRLLYERRRLAFERQQ